MSFRGMEIRVRQGAHARERDYAAENRDGDVKTGFTATRILPRCW